MNDRRLRRCRRCQQPLAEVEAGLCTACFRATQPTCPECGEPMLPGDVGNCWRCQTDDFWIDQHLEPLEENA